MRRRNKISYYRTSVYKKILIFINVCFVIAYLLVCLVPFVNTGVNWIVAIPGIIFPILFFVLLAFIILWIILKSKFLWVSVTAVLLGFQQVAAVFSFHFPSGFSSQKQPNTLRVMQWNVMGFDQPEEENMIENGFHSLRPQMMDVIQDQNADVLCLEEFYESKDTSISHSNISLIANMGFAYHYFVPLQRDTESYTTGIAIFSKYPITDTAQFDFNRNKRGEHLIYADIKVNDKTFRIFATHLIAINFADWDNQREENEESASYSMLLKKLLRGYSFRYHQSLLVGGKIAESPYPSIICGDFNDIPNSSTYFNIKGDLQDPFLKKGFWTGRTTRKNFGIISPTLRIDYILVSKKFNVNQFQIIHVPYSDHYPVKTDLQY